MFEQYKTLNEIFHQACEKNPSKDYLKWLEDETWKTWSFDQVKGMKDSLAAALYDRGVRKGDKVGIISDNRWQWIISDLAVLSLGAADVPRGSDSTSQEINYILNHSESRYCFVENPEQADKVLAYAGEPHGLKAIFLLTGKPEEVREEIPAGIKVESFEDLLTAGKKSFPGLTKTLAEIEGSVGPEDLATLIYTSGTTGQPKGVMLAHADIMHNIRNLPEIIPIVASDRWLSILPVWHIFERTLEYIILSHGCLMGYSKPTANFLLPALEEIRPTHMASVPRVWEALHTGILKKTRAASKIRYLMLKAFAAVGTAFWSCKLLLTGMIPRFHKPFVLLALLEKLIGLIGCLLLLIPDQLGNLLVFRKIRMKTGGCLKLPISGGGALPAHVDRFFAAVKIDIFEGYGLTETSPVIAVRTKNSRMPFTVGKPIPNVEVRICGEDGQPLANQHHKGIVHCRGDLVMKGYYKDSEKTAAVLSKDGWFNTGDLGRLTVTGQLQLRGRAKDTIVLTGGENIEPEPIEALLTVSPMIHQCMVYGQDKKRLSVMIVPDQEALVEWASAQKIPYADMNELCNTDKVLDEYKRIVDSKISTHNGFKSFEKIFCILLLPDAFKVGEEITHSLKLKRNVIAEKYKNKIEIKCYTSFGD